MKVQTVLGLVDPEVLGKTLTHEHMALDFSHFYRPPPEYLKDKYDGKIRLNNVGFIKQRPYSSKDNINFSGNDTMQAIYNDVKMYKEYGGGTICENTPVGIEANIAFMKDVSRKTGVHVIAGTGYYIADVQTNSTLNLTKEQMYDYMLKELTAGCAADETVKAGFIGEVGSVYPIHDFEKRAIQATAEVQQQLGCGVTFHPHRDRKSPFEIMRLYLEAGGNASKAIMSHLDRTLLDDESVMEFSNIGCYCQWDLFGVEVSHYQLHLPTDMPSDAQRVAKVKMLCDAGKTDKVLLSHDIHTKHRLIDFGGHGYSHILNNIVPKMLDRGISPADVQQITVTNPKNWLMYDIKN